MPNGVPNIGSALAGDPQAQQAIQAAIQARGGQGQPVPQLAQTGQQPGAQVPRPTPGVPPPSQAGPTPISAPAPIKTEAELIIKGLTQRLSAISKVETAGVERPQQPSPRVAPTI